MSKPSVWSCICDSDSMILRIIISAVVAVLVGLPTALIMMGIIDITTANQEIQFVEYTDDSLILVDPYTGECYLYDSSGVTPMINTDGDQIKWEELQ